MKDAHVNSAFKILVLFLILFNTRSHGQATITSSETFINESKFVSINGIDQWVTFKGNRAKPIILFLHGGPGSPISPYSDALYAGWENDFILVQWDQRGSGRTYGRNAPPAFSLEYCKEHLLTVEQMTSDGIALTEYLLSNLKKSKVILFGTSWGSVLGIKMAEKRPDLFYAYVGHSQIVNPGENIRQSYVTVMDMAKAADDQETLSVLNEIGVPPYASARNSGKLMRVIKKYERQRATPPPPSWFHIRQEYDNEQDELHRNDGDDYSFLQYVGDSGLGIPPMSSKIDLPRDNKIFSIPIYFIQGEGDLLTTSESTKRYFESIKAPEKEYILLPNTAHGFNVAVLETKKIIFNKIALKQ